jgi:plastocyanin
VGQTVKWLHELNPQHQTPAEQRSKEKWVTVQRAVGTQGKSTKQQIEKKEKKKVYICIFQTVKIQNTCVSEI